MFKSTIPHTMHDPAAPVQNLVDDEVMGAAKVLFGQSFLNLRNLSYAPFPTPNPDEGPAPANDSERPSSPDASEEEIAAIRRFAGSVFAISEGRRKRKAPKRYDPDDEEKNMKRNNLPAPKIKRGKAEEKFSQSPSPSHGLVTEDESQSESSSALFIRAVGRVDIDDDEEKQKVVRPRITSKKTSRRCDYCGATTTPMWRHGPVGYDDLCNRCGVKWMRGRILGNLTRAG